MRRFALALVVAGAAATFAAPADASLWCRPLVEDVPITGYGPFCSVRCALGADPEVNPKDVRGTLQSLVVACPA